MTDSLEKVDQSLGKAIALDEMYFGLKRVGWEPEDLKEYTDKTIENDFDRLDRFAGGELSKIEDPSLRQVLATATVWRMAMLETGATGGAGGAFKCRHDVVGPCSECEKEDGRHGVEAEADDDLDGLGE
jgi:hypothetical protein